MSRGLSYLMTTNQTKSEHITVLKEVAVEALKLKPGAVVVDATLGSGGHTKCILKALKGTGLCLSLDVDKTAVTEFIDKYGVVKNHLVVCSNFTALDIILKDKKIEKPDAILADLGWRSEQFEFGHKGFSFRLDEPLVMTYGQPEDYPFTAFEIVNDWEESNIADILYYYGDERHSRRIAAAICDARKKGAIKTSKKLADIISQARPKVGRYTRLHPATKSFQALRIAVNDELSGLRTLLEISLKHLKPGGRLVIITFHSLEDRLVKNSFKDYAKKNLGLVVLKKPLTPDQSEIAANPRARSAKLRIFEKT